MIRLRTLDDQHELVESFTRPAEALLPLARLREGGSPDGEIWQQLAELGWLGISLDEELGGIGLGSVEEALTAETLARHLLTPCFLATVIASRLTAACNRPDLATQLASGATRAALGLSATRSPDKAIDAENCSFALLISEDGVGLRSIEKIVVHDDVHWSLPVHSIGLGKIEAVTRDPAMLAFARLLGAATLAGMADESCRIAVDYAKVREQFGQPIGAFQAVKHHCANMAIAAYGARELVHYAAMAIEDDDGEAVTLAGAALNFAARAARSNSGTCIQVHGGIGFSAEADPHHFVKRTHLMEDAFGGRETLSRTLVA